MKLPKQIGRWIEKSGLKPSRRSKWRHHYMRGHGRQWRVSSFGQMQMSCAEAEFDRWSNSVEYAMPLPTNESDFIATVLRMASEAEY